jgi:hypothetical protein
MLTFRPTKLSVLAPIVSSAGVDRANEESLAVTVLSLPLPPDLPEAWPDDFRLADDHDLLLGGLADAVAENRASAQRWLRLVTFFRRRELDYPRRHREAPHFALTAREVTVVEVGELWGMSDHRVGSQLNTALALSTHFDFLWQLCLQGRCDAYRATLAADLARHALDRPDDLRTLATRLERFLRKHLKTVPGLDELADVDSVLACTPKQLRNRVNYEIRKLRSPDAEEEFRKALAQRGVAVQHGSDDQQGLSWLTIGATTDQATIAWRRLTLAAKQRRADGDERTLDQLRSDLAMDLLTGREAGVPLPAYARPVVNLTVPIQTVMGLSDSPGVLSGGHVVPAGLARMIAQTPGATWHRMLTDPAGRMIELSTTSYQPNKAIWEQVVAEYGVCFRPRCDTPATESELDHRVVWPEGDTTPENLWPGCKRDHKAKHAPGFRIVQTDTGSFAIQTPAGFTHHIDATEHPVEHEWADAVGIQHSAAELIEGLTYVKEIRDDFRPRRWDLEWEHGYGGDWPIDCS